MSWLIVRSPHNGREVKVREKDLGRSVRDGDNQIFYLLKNQNGDYYGSMTREGGPDQEAHYDSMLATERQGQAVGQQITQQVVHDATGKRRSGGSGKLVVLIFVVIAAAVLWAIFFGPLKDVVWKKPPDTPIEKTPDPSGG
jgi:hypothetical protein